MDRRNVRLVDEDEGSCPQKQVNRAGKSVHRENRKISGSLPGTPLPVLFPLRITLTRHKAAWVTRQTKRWRVAERQIVPMEGPSCVELLVILDRATRPRLS